MNAQTTLQNFLESFYIPSRIELSELYCNSLAGVVRRFSEHLGYTARLSDLEEGKISSYLMAYRKNFSPRSTNNQRSTLLTLWFSAFDAEYVNRAPRPRLIRRLKLSPSIPTAWTAEQCNKLFSTAASLRGMTSGIKSSDWWLSLLLCIYWTSSRIGSMMAVETVDYDGEGLMVRKQKNKRPQWYPLPASCRAVIERTKPENRKMMWPRPWSIKTKTHYEKFRAIVEAAELPAPKVKGTRNLFHKLRRSTITLCASSDPAIAQQMAGHESFNTTRRHYIDPRLLHAKSAVDILPEPVIVKTA